MPAIKVSQKALEALLRRPHTRRTDYFDQAHSGLCITVGPRGGVWYYFRRMDGKLLRLRLGTWPQTGIAAARQAAGKLEEAIAAGKHPKAEQARQTADKTESRRLDNARLVAKLAGGWRQHHLPGLATKTAKDYDKLLRDFEHHFADRDAGTISRAELVRYLDTVHKRSAVQANRAAVVIRQLFAYGRDRYDLPTNPAADIRNPAKQAKRKRTLNRDEIRIVWRACELAGYPYGHALRFALCTGQRIGEIGGMRWTDIDGDYWNNAENKSDQRIDIYIASHARAVLDDCPRIANFVFCTGRAGADKKPVGLRSDSWGGPAGAMRRHMSPALEQAAQELALPPITDPFTPHDLRRTVRTGLTGWAGVLPDTAERVLNHALSGLRAVYDYADYRPHVADALQRWDAELGRILRGETAAVVPLRQTG